MVRDGVALQTKFVPHLLPRTRLVLPFTFLLPNSNFNKDTFGDPVLWVTTGCVLCCLLRFKTWFAKQQMGTQRMGLLCTIPLLVGSPL